MTVTRSLLECINPVSDAWCQWSEPLHLIGNRREWKVNFDPECTDSMVLCVQTILLSHKTYFPLSQKWDYVTCQRRNNTLLLLLPRNETLNLNSNEHALVQLNTLRGFATIAQLGLVRQAMATIVNKPLVDVVVTDTAELLCECYASGYCYCRLHMFCYPVITATMEVMLFLPFVCLSVR